MLDIGAGILIPLLGTTLGAGCVLLMKRGIKPIIHRLLLGFASGVMIAASVWSLIIPAVEMAEKQGKIPWVPAAAGFLLGIVFLLALDWIVARLFKNGRALSSGRSSMLVLAVTLHNIPEGMAVGVAFAGALTGEAGISMAAAFALSTGIAIQNIPEGAVISMPLLSGGMSKGRAFTCGMLSGAVEPAGALLTLWLTSVIKPVLPYLLSFAAGAMICVVVEELIPEAQSGERSIAGVVGAAAGFVIMMTLDIALG